MGPTMPGSPSGSSIWGIGAPQGSLALGLQGYLRNSCYKSAMDKKALTREYKETQRPMGVYQVRNTVNGKVLIGTSVDLPSILNRLRGELRLGGLRNRALQQDWNEHGP